jgi:hypothetical protein
MKITKDVDATNKTLETTNKKLKDIVTKVNIF